MQLSTKSKNFIAKLHSMKFDRFIKKLLRENVESFEEYDDWGNWLDYESSYIEPETLTALIKHFNISYEFVIPDKILKLYDNNQTVWLEKDDTYEVIATNEEGLDEWITRMQDYQKLDILGISENDLYIGGWECTIGDAREHPGTVYHYTTEEKWEEIQNDGYIYPESGTGLTNRHISGVFACNTPDTYADGTYGDVCLAINLSQYMKENNLKEINMSPEPEVEEEAINSTLRHVLGMEETPSYISSDMSETTVVVGHSIPTKYIEVYGN